MQKDAEQVEYLGRWIDKQYFRAYVYGESGETLANSWDEYCDLLKTGKWFSTPEDVTRPRTGRKPKHVPSTDSETVHN